MGNTIFDGHSQMEILRRGRELVLAGVALAASLASHTVSASDPRVSIRIEGDRRVAVIALDERIESLQGYLCAGVTDGGATTNGWSELIDLGEIYPEETSREVVLPEGVNWCRVFTRPYINGGVPVEFLHSSGADQYIKTGFYPNFAATHATVHFKMYEPWPNAETGENVSWVCAFGSRNANSSQFFIGGARGDVGTRDDWFYRYYGTNYDPIQTGRPSVVGEHVFSLDANVYSVEGQVVNAFGMASGVSAFECYVFAVNNANEARFFAPMDLYSLVISNDTTIVRNFVPCRRNDGVPALYDTVSRGFFLNEGATPLVCGPETWMSSSSTPLDLSMPVTAVWVGGGDRTSVSDFANWECRNAIGEVLERVVPTSSTAITISGNTSFNVPPGQTLSCSTLDIQDCTLTADCDWRGLVGVAINSTVDLGGHVLRLASLAGSGTLTGGAFDLTSADAPGSVSSPNTFVSGTTAANLFNDNFVSVVDATHRAIVSTADLPMIVDYDFGEPTVVDTYFVTFAQANDFLSRAPRAWTFEASSDGETWTVLDTRSDETHWDTKNQKREFECVNVTPYRYYRFQATAAQKNTDGYLELVQLEYGCRANRSEVRVDVPADAVVENRTLALEGNLCLVKEGAGTLTADREQQTYYGGTRVQAGKLQIKCGSYDSNTFHPGSAQLLGQFGTTVAVASNAVFNVAGCYGYKRYNFLLEGGALGNMSDGVAMTKYGSTGFGDISLTADSTYRASLSFVQNWPNSLVDLGGHHLDFVISDGAWIYWGNTALTNGSVHIRDEHAVAKPGAFSIVNNVEIDARTVDFTVDAQLRVNKDLHVHDYVSVFEHDVNYGNDLIKVHGTFRPVTDYFHGCELQDGATLDLSAKTGTWCAIGAFSSGATTMGVAEDARITLDIHGREPAFGEKLVDWNEFTRTNVVFVFDAATAERGIAPVVTMSGIYYGVDLESQEVATAEWIGERDVTNASNWVCRNAAGVLLPDALPTSGTTVYVSGESAPQFTSDFQFGRLVLGDLRLTADCDWRGLGKIRIDHILNLDGHQLRLRDFTGTGTIKDSNPGYIYTLCDSVLVDNCWANIEYTPACADRIEMKVAFRNLSKTQCLWCSRGTDTQVNTFTAFLIGNDNLRFDRNNGPTTSSFKPTVDQECVIVANGNTRTCSVNGANVATMIDGVFTPGSPLSLFASHTAGTALGAGSQMGNQASYRFYSFKLYKSDNTLACDIVPVWWGADGSVRLYDRVRNKSISTYGSGSLRAEGKAPQPGESGNGGLLLEVPAGKTVQNDSVKLSDNLKFVKVGEGTYSTAMGHSYIGGTEVLEGTMSVNLEKTTLGSTASLVKVAKGAVLNLNASIGATAYPYDLAGTLYIEGVANYGAWGKERCVFKDVTLSDDVRIVGRHFDFGGPGDSNQTLTMNGHTLTFELTGMASVGGWNIADAPEQRGQIVVSGDTLGFYQYGFAGNRPDIHFMPGTQSRAFVNYAIHGLVYEGTSWNVAYGDPGKTVVYGVYRAGAMRPLMELAGTATLDLSDVEGTWSADGLEPPYDTTTSRTFTQPGRVTFRSGATITVDVHGRRFGINSKVVGWSTAPTGVTFVLDAESVAAGNRIRVAADGVYVDHGMVFYLR